MSEKVGTKLTLRGNEVTKVKEVRTNLCSKMLHRGVISVRRIFINFFVSYKICLQFLSSVRTQASNRRTLSNNPTVMKIIVNAFASTCDFV